MLHSWWLSKEIGYYISDLGEMTYCNLVYEEDWAFDKMMPRSWIMGRGAVIRRKDAARCSDVKRMRREEEI